MDLTGQPNSSVVCKPNGMLAGIRHAFEQKVLFWYDIARRKLFGMQDMEPTIKQSLFIAGR